MTNEEGLGVLLKQFFNILAAMFLLYFAKILLLVCESFAFSLVSD